MTALTEGVAIGTVAMTPDYSVQWNATEFISQGTLLTSPEAPTAVAQRVIDLAIDRSFGGRGMQIMSMNEQRALITGDDELYKLALTHGRDQVIGLSALRANVCLSEGLKRLPQPNAEDAPDIGPHYYAAPAYHAAFIPSGQRSGGKHVWAMSYEDGVQPTPDQIPPRAQRLSRYMLAVERCGLRPDDVAYDDFLQNTLICPEDDGRLRIVKLDVLAAHELEERYRF